MPVNTISNGIITNISTDRRTTFVTVTYMENSGNRRREQTIRLVVEPRTVVLNTNGIPVPASALEIGMTIDATFSSSMTRSIPPQANAFMIRIVRPARPRPRPPRPKPQPPRPRPPRPQPQPPEVTVGTILNVDRNSRSFTTISNQDFSTIIRFNVSDDTRIFDRSGRPINFGRLSPGMRVRVRHANFMTPSIPPQTTAFEVQVL